MVLQGEIDMDQTTNETGPSQMLEINLSAMSEAQLCALVEEDSNAGRNAGDDSEQWAQRLVERAARLDATNVGAMLAAAGQQSAKLAARLGDGANAATALRARAAKCEELLKGAAAAARDDAARADSSARRLLAELERIFQWLDAPALRALDNAPDLSSEGGRARALAAGNALKAAIRGESTASAGIRRLAAVQERLRKLGRAKERLSGALARHINNLLIHLGNEAGAAVDPAAATRSHHSDLLVYAPFMRWLKDMDEKSYDALVKVYVSTWSKVLERASHAACETARASPLDDTALDNVLTFVEKMCDAEQDFCTQFLCLDVDFKAENSDGDRSERSEGGDSGSTGPNAGASGTRRSSESRKLFTELFPSLETELVALITHIDKNDTYGAMRALACASRHVLSDERAEGRWAAAAAAAAAVAAKRAADRMVSDMIAAMPDHVKQAQRRPKCGVLQCVEVFEEWSSRCERVFSGGRRSELDRWYTLVTNSLMQTISTATHPRSPPTLIQLENYHRLHASVSQLRVASLEQLRKECRSRYSTALETHAARAIAPALDKLSAWAERVAAALALGTPPAHIAYRTDCSKHELKKLLPLYPPQVVRKSLYDLYRGVEKEVSESLVPVVWRAMQQALLNTHREIQSRIAECYPGSGLAVPITTQEILDAFSDIAREH